MAPAAGSSLQCEPVFDLIADKIKAVCYTQGNHVTWGIVTTMACVGGVFYGEEDKGELSVQDQGL